MLACSLFLQNTVLSFHFYFYFLLHHEVAKGFIACLLSLFFFPKKSSNFSHYCVFSSIQVAKGSIAGLLSLPPKYSSVFPLLFLFSSLSKWPKVSLLACSRSFSKEKFQLFTFLFFLLYPSGQRFHCWFALPPNYSSVFPLLFCFFSPSKCPKVSLLALSAAEPYCSCFLLVSPDVPAAEPSCSCWLSHKSFRCWE